MWHQQAGKPVARLHPLSNTFYSLYRIDFNEPEAEPRVWKRQIKKDLGDQEKVTVDDDSDSVSDISDSKSSVPVEEDPSKIQITRGNVARAIIVRLFLISHVTISVWRVMVAFDNNLYGLLVLANIPIILEGALIIYTRGGIEHKWWSPCFVVYLMASLPTIWLLQLNQYYVFTRDNDVTSTTVTSPATISVTKSTIMTTNAINTTVPNVTNGSSVATTATDVTNTSFVTTVSDVINASLSVSTVTNNASVFNTTMITTLPTNGLQIADETSKSELWVIIIEESLIYLIVFSRWLLPRGHSVSREFLADLLLEFLAIASDIMELLAVFDEESVRGSLTLTYWVMAVWSASFLQFIPLLAHKRKYFRVTSPKIKLINRACGDNFVEVVVTCMAIFLQDGPFLVLRLFIIITLDVITYSLIFFVLKNIVSLTLLFYRLFILCYRLPCCHRKAMSQETVQNGQTDSNRYHNSRTVSPPTRGLN